LAKKLRFSYSEYVGISVFCIILVGGFFFFSSGVSWRNPLDVAVLLFPIVAIVVGIIVKKRLASPTKKISDRKFPMVLVVRAFSFGVFLSGLFLLFCLRPLAEAIRYNRPSFSKFGFEVDASIGILISVLFIISLVGLIICGRRKN